MFSAIGYACAAVILGLFALSTIAIDVHTAIRNMPWQRNTAANEGPHLRLVGGSSPNRPQDGDGVSQSAA